MSVLYQLRVLPSIAFITIAFHTLICGLYGETRNAPPSEIVNIKEKSMVSSLLAQAAEMPLENYNPGSVIRAVNALHPLGKDSALARIESYLANRDTSKDAYGLFWVLRVLFEMPANMDFPPVRIGTPSIPPPAESERLPRFPVVLIRDVPFLVVHGYSLAGLPQPVEDHVAYFREHGILREYPLSPPDSMEGIQEAFLNRWKEAYEDQYATEVLTIIKAQIDRLTRQ